MAGIRLGAYHFTTDEDAVPSDGFEIKRGGKDGFAIEAFYNYFFLDQVGVEATLGSANRDDLIFESEEIGQLFGSANVYPIAVGIKLTPLSGLVSDHYQPYFHGGGSLVITREMFQGGKFKDLYALYERGSKSRTDFGWWIGAGFESYISSVVCVTSNFKYHFIDYSKPIAGYKDHSGYQITLGVAYILRKK